MGCIHPLTSGHPQGVPRLVDVHTGAGTRPAPTFDKIWKAPDAVR